MGPTSTSVKTLDSETAAAPLGTVAQQRLTAQLVAKARLERALRPISRPTELVAAPKASSARALALVIAAVLLATAALQPLIAPQDARALLAHAQPQIYLQMARAAAPRSIRARDQAMVIVAALAAIAVRVVITVVPAVKGVSVFARQSRVRRRLRKLVCLLMALAEEARD